jgi:hypothetical protein
MSDSVYLGHYTTCPPGGSLVYGTGHLAANLAGVEVDEGRDEHLRDENRTGGLIDTAPTPRGECLLLRVDEPSRGWWHTPEGDGCG